MNEKLIGYARLVAIAASQNQLGEEAALAFCRDAVPLLLAELEVLGRVNQKFEVALNLALPEAQEAKPELKVVSAPIKAAKKVRKSRKKKARAK
jgi:hypothetical protein